MTTKPALTLLCFLVPFLTGASPLDIYGRLLGKAVLSPSALPALPEAITDDLPTETTNAIARIEGELSKRGIAVIQNGPHFVLVFPENLRGFLTNVPLYAAGPATSEPQPATGTGIVDFTGADLGQVLEVYAAISQRTILRPMTLPLSAVNLKSTCQLSGEETAYAISTVLALNGIAVVKDGEKFAQVVPIFQRADIKTRAPKPEAGAKLFDPNKVPSTAFTDHRRPLTETERMEREFERLRKAFCDFIHYKGPPKRPAKRLLEFYATLAGKTAEASKGLDELPIWFHVETPLTKSELLYAIETTFALNNLAVIPVDDHRIRLGHLTDPGKGAGKQTANPHPDR